MIIKELSIKNFRSYYGDHNKFEFSDGLTLIIGDNGDGKTTFFEALQWLLNTTIDNSNLEHVSEMRKSKMEIGDVDEVAVYMKFEHDGEKSVEKSFTFEKLDNGGFKLGKLNYRGYETNGSERESVNGKTLIERCYDAFIQRFSMFKGESDLNVFDDRNALKQLVDKFSDIRKFDDLVEISDSLKEKANSAYLKEMRSDKKVASKTHKIDIEMTKLSADITAIKYEIQEKRKSIDNYVRRLSELEDNQEASERYRDIKERLKTQEEKRNRYKAQIESVNYNHSLLDKMWILVAFPPVLKAFQEKINAISKLKIKMDKDFERTKAIELGKLEAYKDMQGFLKNGTTELPWYLPDQQTMEDMINDQVCKVCGREAPVGSEAYEFMINKLEEYKRHSEAKLKRETEKESLAEQSLFTSEHIDDLRNLAVSLSGTREAEVASYAQEIADRQELVASLTTSLKKTNAKIQEIIDEKARLLIQIGNVSETALDTEFDDIRGLYNEREHATNRLVELESELKHLESKMSDLKKELDELNPENSQAKIYKDVHVVLEEIAKAFATAKKDNLTRFLADLEEKANEYLVKLSAADFHGEIRLIQTADESTEIRLFSSNGTEIKRPSGSQKTVMYISVLFAISDFTQEKREEDYPLIFDAATSSFGDSKEEDFYNVIDKIQKQCIIVTKDFIEKGKLNENAIKDLTCSVYRINKAPNFDQSNMATVRTIINKIR